MKQPTELSIGGILVNIFHSKQHIVESLFSRNKNGKFSMIVAINAEKVISALNDNKLATLLNNATYRYADGIGVVKAVKYKSGMTIPRLPGCEIWELLMQRAGQDNMPVFLVGASPEVIEQTQTKLKVDYHTPIVDFQDGYFTDESALIERIKQSGAQIVTVAMGSPRQEHFIFKCRDAGINAIFMGVGGTYDVYTGNVKRAPIGWQKFGLEWLYRLLSQPTRIKRQLNLFKFLFLMLTKKL